MPLRYPVTPGTLLLCDYGLGGFREPEMVKRRPSVVISPRLPHRDGLCAVVPLSATEPTHNVPYVVRIELSEELPEPFSLKICWAKCDMVATVAFARLDLFRTDREHGARRYLTPKVGTANFDAIMQGVLHGLGMNHLTFAPPKPF